MENKKRPNISGEMDEFQRLSQELSRDENIEISVEDIVKSFENAEEKTLTKDIWKKLENTESNEIEKGDMDSVIKVAKKYNKTNPKKLAQSLKSGDYSRPLILKLGDRYILVAGNTRLCTSAALGIEPKVFIGKINMDGELNEKWSEKMGNKTYSKEEISKLINQAHKGITRTKGKEYAPTSHEIQKWIDNHLSKEEDVSEKWSQKYKDSIDCNNPKGFSQKAHCQGKLKRDTKESMGADSSGSFEAPLKNAPIVKRKINKIHNFESDLDEATDSSSSGQYDVSFSSGRSNPLKINGPDSIKTSRAVKDKNFPKYGGPGGVFVKVKEKCKKYPYCNQGDIKSLEFFEKEGLVESAKNVSNKTGIPYKIVEKLILNEIKEYLLSK
jgi:hypothetical protein